MPLSPHAGGIGQIVGVVLGPEQFVQIAFAGFQPTVVVMLHELAKIKGITVKLQQGKLPGGMVDLLPIAVDQDKPGPGRRAYNGAFFRDHGHRALPLAAVMNENTQHFATRMPGPDIDGQTIATGIEGSLLQQHVRKIGPQGGLHILEGPLTGGHQVQGQ